MAKLRGIVRVPEESVTALKKLFGRGPDFVRTLANALDETGPSLDEPSLRAVSICRRTGDHDSVEDVEEILRDAILPMIYGRINFDVKETDIIYAIDKLFDPKLKESTSHSLDDAHGQRWQECKEAFKRLNCSDKMALEAKAIHLLESRSNRVDAIKVYSDMRPVFDREGEAIRAIVLTNSLAIVLTNSLRIRYREGQRIRTDSFALDPTDLIELKDQVERAIRKNAVLKRDEFRPNVPTLVVRTAEPESDSQ